MLKESCITHLLILQNDFAEVIPSPVGPAIVNVVCPSPPTPIPEYEGAFLTNIVASNFFAILDNFSTFLECIIAVCLLPCSASYAYSIAISTSDTLTIGNIGISISSCTK